MQRVYTDIANRHNAHQLLDTLIDTGTRPPEYADTLFKLGQEFGNELVLRIKTPDTVTLSCTVEDADHLCRGILESLLLNNFTVRLVVFWNKRFNSDEQGKIRVAPIIKEYHEKEYNKSNVLVIIKSIISSSCVVRTNLTRLIESADPQRIFVVAPVLLTGATESLANEFDERISGKFEYLYFAEDSSKNEQGIVLPGIGGDVYQRLGFKGQDDKNRSIPQLVRERRTQGF